MRKNAHIPAILLLTLASVVAPFGVAPARAEEQAAAPTEDESESKPARLRPPPPSSRLFFMPTADVVGPYQMSLSYEGSVLQERGILSSAGVFALGVGDLAQLEYRHTSAIGIENQNVPVPAVGVQLKLPIPEVFLLRGIAIAYRLGVPHVETRRGTDVDERVTDVFAVSKLALGKRSFAHLALRYSQVQLAVGELEVEAQQWLPAVGVERRFGDRTSAILEVGYAPRFELSADNEPTISSGITGRFGLRWRALPQLSVDVSAGYLGVANSRADEVLNWDLRVGGEYFIAWDSWACKHAGLFCD